MTMPPLPPVGDTDWYGWASAAHAAAAAVTTGRLTGNALRAAFVPSESVPIVATPGDDLATKLAEAAASRRDLVLAPGTYVPSAGLTWEACKHSIYGLGDVTIDFSAMTSGFAWDVVGQGTDNTFVHRPHLHEMSRLRMVGPVADSTTVDCFRFADVQGGLDGATLRKIMTHGFRDAKVFGSNNWCIRFHDCGFGRFRRYGANLTTGANAGESYNFHNCVWFDGGRDSTTVSGTAIYVPDSAAFLGANFWGCSFDYNRAEFDIGAGTIGFYSCHFEDRNAEPMGFLSYTAGKAHTAVTIHGGVLNPAETTPRDRLVEMRATSGGGVHLRIEDITMRSFDRATWLFRNMSTALPAQLRLTPLVDNSVGANGAVRISPDTDLLVGDDYATTPPVFVAQDALGGWGKGGTVDYAWESITDPLATYALRMTGTGVVAGTSAWYVVPVPPGARVLITGYYKADGMTGGNAQLQTRFYSADKALVKLNTHATITAPTSGWVPFAYFVTAPPWATLAHLPRWALTDLAGTVRSKAVHAWVL